MENSLGINPENYGSIDNKTYTYEQKPINVADFNEVEEKEVKERIEKPKTKTARGSRKKKKLLKKRKARRI